jgi:hypothetical protein
LVNNSPGEVSFIIWDDISVSGVLEYSFGSTVLASSIDSLVGVNRFQFNTFGSNIFEGTVHKTAIASFISEAFGAID